MRNPTAATRRAGAAYAALLANMEAFRLVAKDRDSDALERILPEDFTLVSHRRFGSTGMRLIASSTPPACR
jgi:hypothetical protein